MDDEDLAAQAESQKLETQDTFAGLGSASGNEMRKGMFSDLFRATGETMGVKLLQRMGWKVGQGVGPKVKRRAKGDASGELHLFAPENSRMIGFVRKTDRKGLGFAGEDRLDESGATLPTREEDEDSGEDAQILRAKRFPLKTKPERSQKSGLGVGVLNDTGSDEEDPYSVGPLVSYNRVIGGDRKKKKGGITASNAVSKPTFISKKLAQRTALTKGFRKCHDGRLPLDGFLLMITPLTLLQDKNKYPPPTIPDGWKSANQTSNSNQSTTTYQSTADAAKSSALDPKSRAALLGEAQLPGKSVFDYLSPAARDRLAAASGKTNLPQARGESAPAGFEASEANKRRTLWDKVPNLDKETAAAALQRGNSGWMPYAEDEDKRSRYRHFLELSAGMHTDLPQKPKNFSVDEWAQELREFADAAEIFKPASGFMLSRFTTSSNAPKLASDAPEGVSRSDEKQDDPAEKAAQMGMYGALTRSREPFYPTRLLCKRFNIKPPATVDPTGGRSAGGGAGEGRDGNAFSETRKLDLVSQASLDRMMMEANFSAPSFERAGVEGGSGSNQQSLPLDGVQAVQPNEIDPETNEALEKPKAGEAIFKAIFGSDDEDE